MGIFQILLEYPFKENGTLLQDSSIFGKHARDPNAWKKVPVPIREENKIAAPKEKSSLAEISVRAVFWVNAKKER